MVGAPVDVLKARLSFVGAIYGDGGDTSNLSGTEAMRRAYKVFVMEEARYLTANGGRELSEAQQSCAFLAAVYFVSPVGKIPLEVSAMFFAFEDFIKEMYPNIAQFLDEVENRYRPMFPFKPEHREIIEKLDSAEAVIFGDFSEEEKKEAFINLVENAYSKEEA